MATTDDRPMVNVYEPDSDGIEQLVYRPMNDAEHKQWKAGQETWRAAIRDARISEVRAELATTDVWVIRATEDGAEVAKPRRKYRADLRATIAAIAASDDPASVKMPSRPE